VSERPPLRIAPSILSADFARLADEIAEVAAHVELLHVDVMDGHYVPNLTIGPMVVSALRAVTDLPLDTHLMIADPRTYGPQFAAAGSTSLTFHPGTDDDPRGLIDLIHESGAEVGLAVRPRESLDEFAALLPHVELVLCMTVEPGFAGQAFMPEVVPKVAEAVARREANGWRYRVEVDGGIGPATVAVCAAAGADTLVAGSAIFGERDRVGAVRAIREAALAAAGR